MLDSSWVRPGLPADALLPKDTVGDLVSVTDGRIPSQVQVREGCPSGVQVPPFPARGHGLCSVWEPSWPCEGAKAECWDALQMGMSTTTFPKHSLVTQAY